MRIFREYTAIYYFTQHVALIIFDHGKQGFKKVEFWWISRFKKIKNRFLQYLQKSIPLLLDVSARHQNVTGKQLCRMEGSVRTILKIKNVCRFFVVSDDRNHHRENLNRAAPPAKPRLSEVNTENGPSSPMRTAQPEQAAKMGSDLRRGPGNRRRARKTNQFLRQPIKKSDPTPLSPQNKITMVTLHILFS